MRLSADREDAGFAAFDALPNKNKTRVLLNGQSLRHVITADEEEGFVIRNVTDADGFHVIVGNEFKSERLAGEVRIILPPVD